MAGKIVATKKTVQSTIPSAKDKDAETEDYMVSGESKEDMAAELDDFERRLEGKSVSKPSAQKKTVKAVPTSNMPPMVAPKDYKKVKATSMTEDEEDKMEALKAVSELDRFEQRLGK
eukprot:304398-Rhodomonas_salina.1